MADELRAELSRLCNQTALGELRNLWNVFASAEGPVAIAVRGAISQRVSFLVDNEEAHITITEEELAEWAGELLRSAKSDKRAYARLRKQEEAAK